MSRNVFFSLGLLVLLVGSAWVSTGAAQQSLGQRNSFGGGGNDGDLMSLVDDIVNLDGILSLGPNAEAVIYKGDGEHHLVVTYFEEGGISNEIELRERYSSGSGVTKRNSLLNGSWKTHAAGIITGFPLGGPFLPGNRFGYVFQPDSSVVLRNNGNFTIQVPYNLVGILR